MNFITVVSLGEQAGNAVARLPDGSAIVTGVPLAKLPRNDLTIGVRPEHLVVAKNNGAIHGVAETVERLGDRTLVYTRLTDGSGLIATDPGMSNVRAGDAIGIDADSTGACFFDKEGTAYHGVQ